MQRRSFGFVFANKPNNKAANYINKEECPNYIGRQQYHTKQQKDHLVLLISANQLTCVRISWLDNRSLRRRILGLSFSPDMLTSSDKGEGTKLHSN